MQRGPAGWQVADAAILACLAIAGLVYFGQYYDCGFNVGDEGSIVLISARLLAGERPFVDVVLGYGLLWCYPLVLLFKITGVSFIAARIYFLALALLTSMLAFLTVRRNSDRRWPAATVALLALAMPGTLHKSYIPLIVVVNMLCLPSFDRRQALDGRRVFGAGLVAAVSYHIRPDLGLVAALVLVATLAAHALSRASGWRSRIHQTARLSALLAAAALVPTVPLLLVARGQGFLEPFVKELYRPLVFLSESVGAVSATLLGFVRESLLVGVAWATTAPPAAGADAGGTLVRVPWDAMWRPGPGRSLAILTYLPLLSLALVAGFACLRMLYRRRAARPMVAEDTVGMLALLGLCGAAFPQFFLFRPDAAHLSQFMPGYMVLAGIVLGRWLSPALVAAASSGGSAPARGLTFLACGSAIGLLVLHVGLYTGFALTRPATGSIAVANGRTERFDGAGGVDVAVNPREMKLLSRVTRVVDENTNEGDVVLCFPFCPGFNVMTGRTTFARRLYVDDGMLRLEPEWQQRMIQRIKIEKVPLIIIQVWAPNGTEISRFRNWSTEVMAYLATCFELVERAGKTRFYRRSPAAAELDACLDFETEQTEAYLRTLDVADLVHRGTDLVSPYSDLQQAAEQLGMSVGELVIGRDYDFERLDEIERQLAGVDRQRALAAIFEQVAGSARSDLERHLSLASFLAKAIHHSYFRLSSEEYRLRLEDPLVLLELGEGNCRQIAAVAAELWQAAGREARVAHLGQSFVTELRYGEGWHYLDACRFGSAEVVRRPDGTLPSVAELSRTPLAIDRPASHLEPGSGAPLMKSSHPYPSHAYFGVCSECPKSYRYKAANHRPPAYEQGFGWPMFTRRENADDIRRSRLAERFQPGAPRLVDVDVGSPREETVTVEIRWHRSNDRDGDLAGYRVYVSKESRGWSYNSTEAAPEMLPYWSHPAGWQASMYDRLFELPKSDVALVTTEVERVRLELEAGRTYYVTVMPFDAHGEAVGREIYRSSQELKISL